MPSPPTKSYSHFCRFDTRLVWNMDETMVMLADNKAKVLVLGASGYIGKATLSHLTMAYKEPHGPLNYFDPDFPNYYEDVEIPAPKTMTKEAYDKMPDFVRHSNWWTWRTRKSRSSG